MTRIFVYRCFYPKCARGLTNQLIFLLNTIEFIKERFPGSVIFLREFYAQFDDDDSGLPFSQIIDIEHLNNIVENIEILDINDMSATMITWGTQSSIVFSEKTFVKMIKENHNLFDDDSLDDPEPGHPKDICIEIPQRSKKIRLRENGGRLENLFFTENMKIPIGKDGSMFTDYVYHMCSIIRFLQFPIPLEIEFQQRNCSVLHLRNETDGLLQWSQQNKMSIQTYEVRLNKKYIDLVEKYISKEHDILLVVTSRRTQNPVIDHLEKSGYWLVFNIFEDIGRECMAISDLVFASNFCNSILISSGGSTYSVLLDARLRHEIHISLNMNDIFADEVYTPKGIK